MIQTVQVFSLIGRKAGAKEKRRRFRLKWRIEGRDYSKSFATKVEGDRFRSELLVAVSKGARFDPGTGRPEKWERSTATWWTWSCEWLSLKWPRWAGKTRSSGVESLVSLTPHLVLGNAPAPPEGFADWLRRVGYRPDLGEPPVGSVERRWLEHWSVPLDELEPGVLEAALTAATTKRDGAVMSAPVIRRRRNALKSILAAAVRRGLIESNPVDRMEWSMPAHSLEIDVATVPGVCDVDRIVDDVASLRTGGARYAALFAMVGLAGVRPSEAAGLMAEDLDLPGAGWGLARLRGAITSPGTRYSGNGSTREEKGLKHRPAESVREVPLPPDLVDRLRWHLERYAREGGRVFTNSRGESVTADNYGPVWVKARGRTWPGRHALSETTVYDLRHTAATTMLRAGVIPSEVARRLGHSVDVLMRIYAGVFEDERERSNALIETELATQRKGPAGGVKKAS